MVSVISSTNRAESNSWVFTQAIGSILNEMDIENRLLNLADLPNDFVFNNASFGKLSNKLSEVHAKHIEQAEIFVFVLPEYNGSFPGSVKAFIDGFPPKIIQGKKALLIGISSGRAGNLRGLEHFTGVLNYLKVHVHPFKPAVAHCHELVDNGELKDDKTISLLRASLGEFLVG